MAGTGHAWAHRPGWAAKLAAPALAGIVIGTAFAGSVASAAPASVAFASPLFVDQMRAGGEPGVIHSNKFGNLVYTSHEGTTHIDRSGGAGSIQQFLCPGLLTADCYKNHVWIWTSDDRGKTWQLRDEALPYTGFSDPDLTQDASGSIYNTGIDLVNDALFSSQDGGKTWPHGTTQCHNGDRPWLAGGGIAGEVYLTTDTAENGHELFRSGNYADSCSATGIIDNGTFNGMSYSGFGKLVYDPFDGSLIEPAQFVHADGSIGVGISRLPHARDAFNGGGETWQPREIVYPTTVYSPFGVPELISMDSAENIYFAWDTNERDPNGTGGCSQTIPNTGGGPTPLPNHIMFVAGKHVGAGQWSFMSPVNLASSNEVSLPLKVAPSNEALRARIVAPANVASDSKVAPSNDTTSALNFTSSNEECGPLNTAPSNQTCLPENLAPANHASSNSTPVRSKSLPDQLVSAVRARRCTSTRTIVSRTSRSFWRTACRRVSSMLMAGGVADHVVVETNSLRWLAPESGSYGRRR